MNLEATDLGWPIYPQGLYQVVKDIWEKYKIPIIITENGIADGNDSKRSRFILDHLSWLAQAIKEGVNVKGYFHWSLIDNFEWHLGRHPKFGLFEVNYETFERTPRKSAFSYGKICKNNSIIT